MTETKKRATSARQAQIRAKFSLLTLDGNECRFVADVMLGRLAKWLRIAGFDVLYSNKYGDDELIAVSNREERILLSRDTRLLVRRSVRKFIYLESEKIQEQIRQVFDNIRVAGLHSLLTRCLSCNELLEDTPRESVLENVPPFVYKTQRHFKTCPKCRKIFWAGTHRGAVMHTLEKVLKSPPGE
jgi:uncharacterized protein